MNGSPRQQSNTGKHGAKSRRKHNSAGRFRGLTCASCRTKKVRCEGSQPTCKTCEIYQVECHYDKTPSMAQVVALAKRLQESEALIAKLQANRHDQAVSPTASEHHGPRVDKQGHQADADNTVYVTGSAASPRGQAPASTPSSSDVGALSYQNAISTAPLWPQLETAVTQTASNELTVDENGKVSYYGLTSAVYDPPATSDSPASSTVQTSISRQPTALARADLHSSISSCVREMTTWEEFALGNASLQTGIPRQIMGKLLHVYWTWVSPMFMWVFRPAFIRDMATGGPYYSEFLLTVICGHSAKYHDSTYADFLLTRARRLLGTAIQQPSSIPTVQALLQLSARDLAAGSISQAWVYSGIAFRMASDLGLQHSNGDIKGLGPVDIEARRRLFWGCYFWDKATSLYAGRLPAVTELLDPSSLDLLDTSTDHDAWTPYRDTAGDPLAQFDVYPHNQNNAVSCFVNSCRLAIIINDIVVQLYSKRSNRGMAEASLHDIKSRLELWRAESPAHLRYDVDNLPSVSPPPHIISQNLLYFTSVILAHRPFWSTPSHYKTCITASQSIEKLVLLLEATFGLKHITYLMGYCIYTGASAILEDAKSGNKAAHATLQTFLRALNAGMQLCPLLERSLNIIIKGMTSAPSPRRENQIDQSLQQPQHLGLGSSATDIAPMPPVSYGYIPAFPYLDPVGFSGGLHGNLAQDDGSMGLGFSTGLDCFPELHFDLEGFVGAPI